MATSPTHAHADPLSDTPLGAVPGLLLRGLADNWWLLLLRGVAAIVFGVLALVWPHITLIALTILFGAYVLVDGVLSLGAAITGRGGAGRRWWLAIVGVAGVAAGVITFMWPGMTLVLLLAVIAAWAIVIGVFEIIGAIRLRREIDNEWALILTGVLWAAFGVALVARPAAGAVGVAWILGTFAILIGIAYVVFSLRLRKLKRAA
jgi:uncharacterized membrane protein HdeD (DUF308 family)